MSAGTVGKSPYDSEAVRRMIYEPDWKTLENISEQAKDMLEKRDYEGVGRLLRRYGESENAVSRIAFHMHKADLSRTPEKAAEKGIMRLFDILSGTYLMRNGRINPEENSIPKAIAAKHTFMLDHYVREHPDCGIARPEAEEVKAAVRILDGDTMTQDKAFSELYGYLMMCQPTVCAVAVRDGGGLQAASGIGRRYGGGNPERKVRRGSRPYRCQCPADENGGKGFGESLQPSPESIYGPTE